MEPRKPKPKPNAKRTSVVVGTTPAGEDHQVVSVLTKGADRITHMRKPCADCPWRRDAVGVFPAEAFRHSARTAYDMAEHTFGCHSSSTRKPATCAGFLLRGAEHNLSVRLAAITGRVQLDQVDDDGLELFDNYREMAIANGVDPDDPVLAPCRD